MQIERPPRKREGEERERERLLRKPLEGNLSGRTEPTMKEVWLTGTESKGGNGNA